MTESASRALAKVPAITAVFWIIKVLSTTVGETFADYLSNLFSLPDLQTALFSLAAALLLIAVQISSKRYRPWLYWPAIVAVSTSGTLITDTLHTDYNVANWQAIVLFGSLLTAVLLIWYRREGTLEMKSITNPKREAFYWLAIILTFTAGTASGDIFLDDLGWPLWASLTFFAFAMLALTALWRFNVISSITTFWICYVLSRPLGAAMGDLLSLPKDETGLGLGAGTTTAIFLSVIAALVIYLSVSKRDRLKA